MPTNASKHFVDRQTFFFLLLLLFLDYSLFCGLEGFVV